MSKFEGDAISISRYFFKFSKLIKLCPDGILLKGDQMFVERLPELEIKTKSGLVIVDASTHKETMHDKATEFALVLAVGPGQLDENGHTIEPDSKPGDVVLLPRGGIDWYSTFGHLLNYEAESIARMRDAQVPCLFRDYKKVFEVLNYE